MNKNIVLQSTITFVQATLQNAEGGHDWWHIHRVWKTAQSIAVNENVDTFVVELAALLHDIADSKFHGGDETVGPKIARQFLETMGVDENTITHVVKIIENISFKGGNETQHFKSLELDVVQDADRLDAMGAIGIARAFNYGGDKKPKIIEPTKKQQFHKNKKDYKKNKGKTN